jgi:hypothetical protein
VGLAGNVVNNKPTIRKWIWGLIVGLVVVLLILVLGLLLWGLNPAQATPEALQALRSDDSVLVEVDPWLIFDPNEGAEDTGLILYPGGHVDPRAYAPAARSIAEQGHLVVIVPMPLNLAVFGANKADKIIEAYPVVISWVIGGHSLGGAMSARYAFRHPEKVQGLVLWASYPAGTDDLHASGLRVASIYGTRDGLTSLEDIRTSETLLPADTLWIEITGGNHAQFGYYGPQSGDLEAEISMDEQQRMIVEGTLAVLSLLDE